ncbi:MAG: NmrA family NAD(P)-binding protein, partial [Anaerolineales bacterium]
MILVTGAGGKTGQAIMRALAVRGEAVRAFTSRTQKAWLRPLTKEFYFGDLRDEAALREAAKGAQALYHICPNMHPEELTIGRNAIAAAKAAGIAQFVYHSVLHPQTEKMPHHWNKLRVEGMLFESGLPFT